MWWESSAAVFLCCSACPVVQQPAGLLASDFLRLWTVGNGTNFFCLAVVTQSSRFRAYPYQHWRFSSGEVILRMDGPERCRKLRAQTSALTFPCWGVAIFLVNLREINLAGQ